MFVGHLALALAGKRASRSTSLVWFVVAVCFVDLLWPIFMLAGVEHARIDPGNTAFTPMAFDSYPWTHSLLMGVVWGAALGLFARWRGVSSGAAWLIGALVVSHWVLDLITHRPDLPLWPWPGSHYGLGLWNSIGGTFVVEGLIWIVAIALFLGVRRPRGVHGQIAFWSFAIVSTLIWASGPFSPPPPDQRSLALFALTGWIIVPWAWWIERTSEQRRRYRHAPAAQRWQTGCMSTALAAGTRAPDFTLPSTPDQSVSLSDLRGRPVVLAFYPADWSPVCGDQMALYNEILSEIHGLGAELIGISVDGIWCHVAFAQDRHLHFPLLADFEPKGEVARRFGVYREHEGTSERALFVIDADGVIRWSYVSPIGINPGADGFLTALEEINGKETP